MGLNIKNAEVERLAAEAAAQFGETKTQAIKRALEERLARSPKKLYREERYQQVLRILETVVWPAIPESERGKGLTKAEREDILGIGPDGV